jgi:Family of unknown function (DUF6058)
VSEWTNADVNEYLTQQYVSIEWLAEQSGVAVQQLEELVRAKCIPGPSYEMFEATDIGAFTSDHPVQLTRKCISRHFSPFVVAWINRAKPMLASMSLPVLQVHLMQQFRIEYRSGVLKNGGQQLNYKKLFDGDGTLNETRFSEHFEQTWNHWWNGTWGICVIQSDSFDRIALKQIAVERLVQLTENGMKQSFTEAEASATRKAIEMYEEIVLPFSRHDHKGSSRWRLIENVLPRLGAGTKHFAAV